jgi:hypothetical protein
MFKRSLLPSFLLTCFAMAIVAGLFFAAPGAPSAANPPHPKAVYINWVDTGKTVPLAVGQQLVVKLPIRTYKDDSWHVKSFSGDRLKLVGGPDELRPVHWDPWKFSFQVFYFQREAPGTANLVMEPNYFLKPMVLKIVDR